MRHRLTLLIVAIALALGALLLPHDATRAQGPGAAWAPEQITPADAGLRGARAPDMGAPGDRLALQHDGDLVPGGPGNSDGSTEVFAWLSGAIDQLSDGPRTVTADRPSGAFRLPGPAPGVLAWRVAFRSNGDPEGRNGDGSREVMLRTGQRVTQLTAADGGTVAEGPALAGDGRHIAFWHDADLTGDNPDGSIELFLGRTTDGAAFDALWQLTDLSSTPYHSRVAVSADGGTLAFVLEADLTGENADGSWELFLWSGPPTTPGDTASFEQLTDWRPPMSGRELYLPSISHDGTRVAFAGRGHIDPSQPAAHTTIEVYLWTRGGGLQRLTTATGGGLSSTMPEISADGNHVLFLSTSNHDPRVGNDNENAELFLWSDCAPIVQVTDTTGRPNIIVTDDEVAPSIDGDGDHAAHIAEQADDPAPLVLSSRRGILFRDARGQPSPCAAPTTPTPAPGATATPAASATPPPEGQVCPQMSGRIPGAVQAAALAAPEQVYGWELPANPALPPGPNNPMRRWLSLRDPGKPFSPANSVVWKVGCP